MTKQDAEHICTVIRKKWGEQPLFRQPDFQMELTYINVFLAIFWDLRVDYYSDVVPVMRTLIKDERTKVAAQILQSVNEHSENKGLIRMLINDRRLIGLSDWKPYFLTGDRKKAARLIEDYNHWLLAETMWNGFVRSQEDNFIIPFPGHTDAPKDLLSDPSGKPLWGMWRAYTELGRIAAVHHHSNNAINVHPLRSISQYLKQLKSSG
jgi:hypothetical protein